MGGLNNMVGENHWVAKVKEILGENTNCKLTYTHKHTHTIINIHTHTHTHTHGWFKTSNTYKCDSYSYLTTHFDSLITLNLDHWLSV